MVGRPRHWQLAAFLSLLAPGLGQIYNGEWAKAAVLLAVTIPVGIFLVLLLFSPWFLLVIPLVLLFGITLLGYALFDAIAASRKRGQAYELQWFNRVAVYVGVVLVVALARGALTTLFRETFVQAFRIPFESMVPTLLPGDFVFVDKRPVAKNPARGDVIVLNLPEDPRRQYLKRVIGVGGDRVEIRDKTLSINGQVVEEPWVIHIDPKVHPGEFDPRDNFGPYTIPRGQYFVMGDNRDNSNDSRFWGALPHSLVAGRVRGIYWSWDREKHGPRWDRVGKLMPVMRSDGRDPTQTH